MQREPLGRDLLARHLPDRFIPIYKLCAFVALPLAVLLAAARLGLIIVDMAPRYAIVDFRYFYVAGVAMLEGLSAYGEGYIALGQQIYDSSFLNAFFYSPTVLPLLAPLGLMPAGPASAGFMVVTAATIIASVAGSGWILRDRPMLLDWRIVTAVAVVAGAGILRPSVSTLFLGNAKFLMLAGLVLWMAGALRGRAGDAWRGGEGWTGLGLQSVGLAIALMKPQYGLVLFLVCVAHAPWRAGAMGAVAVSGLLYAIAALPHGLFTYGFDFLSSIAAYSGRPENSHEVLIGLYAMLTRLGVEGGVLMTLSFTAMAAGTVFWLLPEDPDPVATALLCVAIGIAVAPTHSTDALLLLPILALLGTAGALAPKLLLAGSYLSLCLVDWILPPQLSLEATSLGLRNGVATVALIATCMALAWTVRSTQLRTTMRASL